MKAFSSGARQLPTYHIMESVPWYDDRVVACSSKLSSLVDPEELGNVKSLIEIAVREGINSSYVSRMVNLP